MDLSKVRGGQAIAAIGGIVLLIGLWFLDWYSLASLAVDTPFGDFAAGVKLGAWDQEGFLGVLANLVILAAGIVAVGLAVVTATSRTVALPIAASALTTALGIASVILILGRMLFQPLSNSVVDLEYGIFVSFVGALVVAYGGWQSMQEEGTTFEEARDQLQTRFGEPGHGSASPAETGPPVQEPPPSVTPPSEEGSPPTQQ